ncbi:hypothetical protein PM082_023486 [Marasmius tenuissimus]|nr:hypothetical protein PM082_023486 [Marasmius tenuissimus]
MTINPTHVALISSRKRLTPENFRVQKIYYHKFFNAINAGYVTELAEAVPDGKKPIDDELCFILENLVDPEYRYLIEEEVSGLASWKKICNSFDSKNFQAMVTAYKTFISITHDLDYPVSAYIQSIESAAKRLKDLGVPQPDETVMCLMVAQCRDLETRAKLYGLGNPDLKSVKDVMLAKADLSGENDGEEVPAIKQESANAARSGYPSSGGGRYGGSAGGSRPPPGQRFRWCSAVSEDQCRRCGLVGHIADRCIHDMPQNVKDWVIRGAPRSDLQESSGNQAEVAGQASVAGQEHTPEVLEAILNGDLEATAPDFGANWVYFRSHDGTISMIEEKDIKPRYKAHIVGRPRAGSPSSGSSFPALHT